METKQMTRYRSKSGKSGVNAYHIGPEDITIQFRNGREHVYSYSSAGKAVVESMKEFALRSDGLERYITRYKPKYEREV